jgi:predicted metal-dependent phosphoesterase TrpH/aminoglycoside phosphotransferase (APT) family kinase protein
MLLEMHAHTAEHSPCSTVAAVDLVRAVVAKGLQGIVITDHHYLWPDAELLELRRDAQVPEHFVVLTGQELSSAELGDVLVYGADRIFPPGTPLAVVREHSPQAALVWAHPYRGTRTPDRADLLHPLLDGVEIFNANQTTRGNIRALQDWHRYRFAAIGGTDTHAASYAGTYPTILDHPVSTAAELAAEIRAGRCRPFLKEIPRAGANSLVTEVAIGAKGHDEVRERIIIRTVSSAERWRSASRAAAVVRAVAAHGFDGGPFRVPRPIDEDPETLTLIEQGLRGKSLHDRLVTASAEDGVWFLQLAARWLARLHECRLVVTPPGEFMDREAGRLDRYVERFDRCGHRQTGKARAIRDHLLQRELQLVADNPELLVQGHGDYHLKNIMVGQDDAGRRDSLYVAAIDFESSYCLPRAFDVGCFLAQFRNQLFRHGDLLERLPESLFIDAYCQASSGLPADFPAQVELFRARTNLSIAAYLVKVGMGESEDLWRVLVEADRAICTSSSP